MQASGGYETATGLTPGDHACLPSQDAADRADSHGTERVANVEIPTSTPA